MESPCAVRAARRPSIRALLVTGLCLAGGALHARQPTVSPPTISLDDTGLSVANVTKSGSVVLFGVSRRALAYHERMEMRAEILVDQDGDGAIVYQATDGLPWKSVWFVADLATGLYDFEAPAGFPLQEVDFPGKGIGSALNSLETAGDFLHVLWVRPAATAGAAWRQSLGDGGASDADGKGDHHMRVEASRFLSIGQSPPAPEKFAPGDLLVGIDAHELSIYAARLAN